MPALRLHRRPAHPPRGSAILLAAALPMLLSLQACRSAATRAAAQSARADALIAQKAYPAAAYALQRATQYDGNDPDLWLKLGHVSVQAGDFAAADQAFQRAAELQPDSVEALENLVVLAVRAGLMDQARRFMDPLLVLQPDDPAGLLAQGAIALRERRYPDALAASEHLITTSPDLTEAYLMRARALNSAGRAREAVALLEKRVAGSPATGDPVAGAREPLLLLLDLYRGMGDVNGVRATASRLHRLIPDDPSYAMETARGYHAQGRDDLADRTIAELRRAHPGSAGVVRAVIDYRRATLPPAAATSAVAALAVGASPFVVAIVANALVDMGAPARALALARPLTGAVVTAGGVDATVATARALAALGHQAEARTRIDQALDFDSGNVPALLTRARFRLAARDLAGALADAQLAQASDDGSEEAALLVAEIYDAQGSAPLAQQSYARAVQSFPDSYALLTRYVGWLVHAGQRGTAIQVAGSYARRHRPNRPAWDLYASLCRQAASPCAEESRELVRIGA